MANITSGNHPPKSSGQLSKAIAHHETMAPTASTETMPAEQDANLLPSATFLCRASSLSGNVNESPNTANISVSTRRRSLRVSFGARAAVPSKVIWGPGYTHAHQGSTERAPQPQPLAFWCGDSRHVSLKGDHFLRCSTAEHPVCASHNRRST